jgi:hypothetical protein
MEDEEAAYEFGQDVADRFLKSSFLGLPPAERNPVHLANELFRAAVKFHGNYRPAPNEFQNPVMMYSDPTYRPRALNWLGTIQSDYYLKQAPEVMGRAVAQPDGTKIFVGPVILDKSFGKSSALINYMQPTVIWRKALRSELFKNAAETELIGTGSTAVFKPAPKKGSRTPTP